MRDYRHIVTVERGTQSANATTNEPETTWAAITVSPGVTAENIPCYIETVTGGEVRRGMQMSPTTTHLVKMAHPNGAFTIDPRDRLNWVVNSLMLNVISAVDADGMLRELTIQCKANA